MNLSEFESQLDIFDYYARHTPNAPFLVEDSHISLSYLESYVLTKDLLGPRLRERCPSIHPQGSSRQPRVLLITPNNSLLLLTIIALWRLSYVAVPVQPRAEPDLWMGMISCSQPIVVITASSILSQVEQCVADYNRSAGTNIPVVSLASLVPPQFLQDVNATPRLSSFIPSCHRWIWSLYPDKTMEVRVAMRDAPGNVPTGDAVTLFTSSAVDQSTVKGVTYTHRFLLSSSIRTVTTMGADMIQFCQQPNRHLGWMPLSHCFEFGISFCGIVLTSGGSYIFFDSAVSSPLLSASTSLPKQLLAAIAYFGDVSSFSGVPFISQGIADASSPDDIARLRQLRYFNVAGAPTSLSLFQWMVKNRIAYADSCGATEVLWIARRRTWHPDESARGLSLCPGLMGVIQKVRAEDTFGELVVIGKNLPARYDDVDTGAFSFDADGDVTTYRTGDLYRHDEQLPPSAILFDGQPLPAFDEEYPPLTGISYIGRVDDTVVLSTGEKVDALAIEQSLERHMHIERSAVVADVDGSALLTLVQPKLSSDIAIDLPALTDVVLRTNLSLPFEKRIRREHIFFVQQLPLTPKNTLHRKRLRRIIASLKSNGEIPHIFPAPNGAPQNQAANHAIQPRIDISQTLRDVTSPEPSSQSSPASTSVTASVLSQSSSDRSPLAQPALLDATTDLYDEVVKILARVFDIPQDYLERRATALADLPLTSLASVEVSRALNEAFSIKLRPAEMYAMHTVDEVCAIIQGHQHGGEVSIPLPQPHTPASTLARHQPCSRMEILPPHELYITGAACRFVGGIDTLSAFWSALTTPDAFLQSIDHIDGPKHRPTASSAYGPALSLSDAASGFTTVQSFATFFRISLRDAEAMSLNTRLVLQLGYEAIQNAGIAPSSLSGKRWGIFTAVNESGWRVHHSAKSTPDAFAGDLLNLADDAAAGRLAYYLNVNGPAIDIKTACSSSAVAIHQASLAIRNDDCDAAIVIAATTHVDPAGAGFRMKAGIASRSGRCLPFSQWADGFVPGEGAAAVVLQKYSDAAVKPYAVLRASAVVQDGTSRGFLSPNPTAQKALLKTALGRAKGDKDDMSFIEAHGTGTQLGDSVELLALADIYQSTASPLYIGSCKAVIGHTEECAGLAGVLKAILCFKYGMIPPQPFTGPLNELLEAPQFLLPRESTPLRPSSQPRLIGISSFGLSGTLAHVILQEPPPVYTSLTRPSLGARACIFVLSAATEDDLCALARRYLHSFGKRHLRLEELSAICLASRLTRDHDTVRRAFYVRAWHELFDELHAVSAACTPRASARKTTVGLWFGMPLGPDHLAPVDVHGCALYDSELRRINWQAAYRFFAAQLALARTLSELGVDICAIGGEGGGELVAGVVAGALSPTAVFSEAESADENTTFAVARCTLDVLEEHLVTCSIDEAEIVGRHSPSIITLRGTRAGLETLATIGDLHIDIQDEIRPCCINADTSFKAPTITLISAHTGGACSDAMAQSPAHWARVQRSFMNSEQAFVALAERCQVVVDLSPFADARRNRGYTVATGERLAELLCQLYEAGCDVDWKKLEPEVGLMERLPSYVWAVRE